MQREQNAEATTVMRENCDENEAEAAHQASTPALTTEELSRVVDYMRAKARSLSVVVGVFQRLALDEGFTSTPARLAWIRHLVLNPDALKHPITEFIWDMMEAYCELYMSHGLDKKAVGGTLARWALFCADMEATSYGASATTIWQHLLSKMADSGAPALTAHEPWIVRHNLIVAIQHEFYGLRGHGYVAIFCANTATGEGTTSSGHAHNPAAVNGERWPLPPTSTVLTVARHLTNLLRDDGTFARALHMTGWALFATLKDYDPSRRENFDIEFRIVSSFRAAKKAIDRENFPVYLKVVGEGNLCYFKMRCLPFMAALDGEVKISLTTERVLDAVAVSKSGIESIFLRVANGDSLLFRLFCVFVYDCRDGDEVLASTFGENINSLTDSQRNLIFKVFQKLVWHYVNSAVSGVVKGIHVTIVNKVLSTPGFEKIV